MAANTPYWGELPSPKTAVSRRPSVSQQPERRLSLDAATQTMPRANRASVQTTVTDAPTESTLSPFASPISSSFPSQGLAPRPPSYPYGADRYPQQQQQQQQQRQQRQIQDNPECGRRRSSRGHNNTDATEYEHDTQYHIDPLVDVDDTESLPAAPDVRAPPAGYRSPSNVLYYGFPPIISNTPSSPRNRELSPATDSMDLDNPEQYYTTAVSRKIGDARLSGSGPPSVSGDYVRRSSTRGGPSNRRKKLEQVRSPLQKLELTLDSITKEEKRARVVAAEKIARQRESQGAGRPVRQRTRDAPPQSRPGRPEPMSPEPLPREPEPMPIPQEEYQQPQPAPLPYDQQPQQVQHAQLVHAVQQYQAQARERSVPDDHEPRPLLQPEASPVEESYSPIAVHQSPVTQYEPEPVSLPEPELPVMKHDTQDTREIANSSSAASGIPQRNLSFRERAEQQSEQRVLAAGDYSKRSTVVPDAMVPKRTSSQRAKLTKLPPGGDPWATKRKAAERRLQASQQTNTSPPLDAHLYAEPQQTREIPYAQPVQPIQSVQPNTSASRRRPSMSGHMDVDLGRSAMGFDSTTDGSRDLATGTPVVSAAPKKTARFTDDVERAQERRFDSPHHHHISNMLYHSKAEMKPGQGTYDRPVFLDEWRKATVGTLQATNLDFAAVEPASEEPDQAWWEPGAKRRGSTSRVRKAEAFDGEYDEANGPTRFKPPLHLVCGPLLRYCGIRKERSPGRMQRNGGNGGNGTSEREFWRGSVMIVTQNSDSSYAIAPTLRLFVQPLELLPPPPSEVSGALPPEYVDPLVGHPKLGRKGETLYVRPVELLAEGKDVSRDETDTGLFERTKSQGADGAAEPAGSFSARLKRSEMDGERAGQFKDVRGFRLHAERGVTFWRFNIEVELREKQQRIAYRINRSPSTGFWVPAKDEAMHIMFHSCNGFSLSVHSDDFSGPDPLWRDVLNTHQTQPFHVMIGGGDQIYNDIVTQQTTLFQEWLTIKNPVAKSNAPFTAAMQDELEAFYLERYAMWFSQGLFGLANSQIPMVNMYDDHDIIDGFGSYPHHFMNSPVFSGLGNVAFKYYMLFQHQSVIGETEESEPSWILGAKPGPYIEELSHSVFVYLGAKVALLAVDCRTERMRDEIISEDSWKRVMDRCYAEVERGTTEHLIVLLGVPIAYPRLVWLENILTSRLMEPIKALGKTGILGGFLNKFDGGVEVLDDLDDHWTAKDHKDERKVLIEDLQDLAADRSVRITILSGDVHLAAVGQFYANPKLGVAKHKDFRYMPNIISSAIVNTPPPDLLADVLNKRNKVHHFDHDTDEDMIPLFEHGVDGKPRNNKRLLPHRNWCSIQPYTPGSTPAATPAQSTTELKGPGVVRRNGSNVLRRNSLQQQRRAGGAGDSRPPLSGDSRPPQSGGLLRSMSRGRSSMDAARRPPEAKGTSVKRSFSLSQDFRPSNIFRRFSTRSQRPADGSEANSEANSEENAARDGRPPVPPKDNPRGVNSRGHAGYGASYGASTMAGSRRVNAPVAYDDDMSSFSSGEDVARRGGRRATAAGMRGGAGSATAIGGNGHDEYETGDETYFSVKRRPEPARRQTASEPAAGEEPYPPIRPFYRTPTDLSSRHAKRAQEFEVNLEGGLDIRLNVEVNPKDPTGITVPYRLLVPRLWYAYEGEDAAATHAGLTGLKRLLSLGRKKEENAQNGDMDADDRR